MIRSAMDPGGGPIPEMAEAPAPIPLVGWGSLALVAIPVGALVMALASHQFVYLDYVHVMSGGLWTGIDLFMGLVIGPILFRLPSAARADFVQHLVPTMLFLMPTLASVTVTAGIYLALLEHIFNLHYLSIDLAGVLVILLMAQGLGIFLPNEVRIVLELRRARPDARRIGRLGLFNARLAGLQAVFQIALIFVMANLASGLVNL